MKGKTFYSTDINNKLVGAIESLEGGTYIPTLTKQIINCANKRMNSDIVLDKIPSEYGLVEIFIDPSRGSLFDLGSYTKSSNIPVREGETFSDKWIIDYITCPRKDGVIYIWCITTYAIIEGENYYIDIPAIISSYNVFHLKNEEGYNLIGNFSINTQLARDDNTLLTIDEETDPINRIPCYTLNIQSRGTAPSTDTATNSDEIFHGIALVAKITMSK